MGQRAERDTRTDVDMMAERDTRTDVDMILCMDWAKG